MNEISLEAFATIDELLKFFAFKFPFGIYDQDDIYQEGWVYALEALSSGRFDPSRGTLKSFLFAVLYSRFINLKRNEYYRPETPCRSCPFSTSKGVGPCEVFIELRDCPLYTDWEKRNAAKKSISCASACPPSDAAAPADFHLIDYPLHLRDLAQRASTGERLTKVEKSLLRSYHE